MVSEQFEPEGFVMLETRIKEKEEPLQKLQTALAKLQNRFRDQIKSYTSLEFTVKEQSHRIWSMNKTMENMQKQIEGNNSQLASITIQLNELLLSLNELNMKLDVREGKRVDNSNSESKGNHCNQILTLFDFGSLRETNQKSEIGWEQLRNWRVEQRNSLWDYIDEFEEWRKKLLRIELNLQPKDLINKFISGLNRKIGSRAYIWFANFQSKHQSITWEAFILSFYERFDYELRKERADADSSCKIQETFGGLVFEEVPTEAHEVNENVRNEQIAIEETANTECRTENVVDVSTANIQPFAGIHQLPSLKQNHGAVANKIIPGNAHDPLKETMVVSFSAAIVNWYKLTWNLGNICEYSERRLLTPMSLSYNHLFATCSSPMDKDKIIYVFDPGGKRDDGVKASNIDLYAFINIGTEENGKKKRRKKKMNRLSEPSVFGFRSYGNMAYPTHICLKMLLGKRQLFEMAFYFLKWNATKKLKLNKSSDEENMTLDHRVYNGRAICSSLEDKAVFKGEGMSCIS